MPDPLHDPEDPAYRPPLDRSLPWPPAGEVGHPNLKEQLYSSLPPEALVVDIGCGPGPFEYEAFPPRFLAFDAFPMTDPAGLRPDHDEFRLGRLDTFPLEDASCDAVVMGFILEHVTNPGQFLREADRVLRPGGWCYVAVPHHRSLEDRLFRMATRLAGSTRGPHIQRFTFDNFTALVESETTLRLEACHRLDASFLWMLHPRLRRLRRPCIRSFVLLRRTGIDLLREGNYQFLFRKTLL